MTIGHHSVKQLLRELLKRERANVGEDRRVHASRSALTHLDEVFCEHPIILSYSSFGDEFCTKLINTKLSQKKKLALPKLDGKKMKVYRVIKMERELVENNWGILEPNPQLCEEVQLSEISLVLVPAIGFDKNNHRIGYGGGFYDRFLAELSSEIPFFGIGYKEQFTKETIPAEPTDIPLSEVFLY
ncbi:MAG: 5-formyltetrahydrofolate cyclo-ligase [Chlamydiota bacterium]